MHLVATENILNHLCAMEMAVMTKISSTLAVAMGPFHEWAGRCSIISTPLIRHWLRRI